MLLKENIFAAYTATAPTNYSSMINTNELNEYIAGWTVVLKGVKPEQALSEFLVGLWKRNVSDIVVASHGGRDVYSSIFNHVSQTCDRLIVTRPCDYTGAGGRLQTFDGKSLRIQGARMNRMDMRGFSFDAMVMHRCDLDDMDEDTFYGVILPELEIEGTMLLRVDITGQVNGEARRMIARRITTDEVLRRANSSK